VITFATLILHATLAALLASAAAPALGLDYILETIDIVSQERSVLHRTRDRIEAPNWSPDGTFLPFNSKGSIYKPPVSDDGRSLRTPDSAPRLIKRGSRRSGTTTTALPSTAGSSPSAAERTEGNRGSMWCPSTAARPGSSRRKLRRGGMADRRTARRRPTPPDAAATTTCMRSRWRAATSGD